MCLYVPFLQRSLHSFDRNYLFLFLLLCCSYFGIFLSTWSFSNSVNYINCVMFYIAGAKQCIFWRNTWQFIQRWKHISVTSVVNSSVRAVHLNCILVFIQVQCLTAVSFVNVISDSMESMWWVYVKCVFSCFLPVLLSWPRIF